MKGWVYIISNQAMPDVIKIGYSTKDPRVRAKELGTGAPYPYHVEYEVLVEHPSRVERAAHQILSGVRAGKEWFECDIPSAIKAIKTACAGAEIYLENRYERATLNDQDRTPTSDLFEREEEAGRKPLITPFELLNDPQTPVERPTLNTIMAMAEQGNADAQYALGCRYDSGDGVRKNLPDGFRWFEAAAKQGHVLASLAVGRAYLNGRGVKKNEQEATPFLRHAADHGDAEAQYRLGKIVYMDSQGEDDADGRYRLEKASFELLKAASDQGYAPAQCELGAVYAIKNGYHVAFDLYRAAALQELAIAQRYLADCYLWGYGCARNLELAEFWYRQAAMGRDKIARSRLDDWEYYCAEFYPDSDLPA